MDFYQEEKCRKEDAKLSEYVFTVKEETCEDDLFVDNKVNVSETAIIVDHVKSETQYDTIFVNVKVEEEISSDIKTEFDRGLLHCEDCHADYRDYCAKCGMLVYILNANIPNYGSQEELPNDILEIKDCFGQLGIYALKIIPEQVIFGPFTGLERTEHPRKIKHGKFVVNAYKYINWMKYINPAKNTFEHNLVAFQYGNNLYYQSICQIQEGDELLVYFGEEYEDSQNRNVEIDFIPNIKCSAKDAFGCTFCCFGFSSKTYLAKHKTICPGNVVGEFSIEDLMQCPLCKIHLDRKEYYERHMACCCKRNVRKYNQTTEVNGRRIRPRHIYKCQQCNFRTKYKADIRNHTNQHYEVKMHKCGVCCRQFKTKEILRLHVENTQMCAGGKEDPEHPTRDYTSSHLNATYLCSRDQIKQSKCSMCEFQTKQKLNLKRHIK